MKDTDINNGNKLWEQRCRVKETGRARRSCESSVHSTHHTVVCRRTCKGHFRKSLTDKLTAINPDYYPEQKWRDSSSFLIWADSCGAAPRAARRAQYAVRPHRELTDYNYMTSGMSSMKYVADKAELCGSASHTRHSRSRSHLPHTTHYRLHCLAFSSALRRPRNAVSVKHLILAATFKLTFQWLVFHSETPSIVVLLFWSVLRSSYGWQNRYTYRRGTNLMVDTTLCYNLKVKSTITYCNVSQSYDDHKV